MVAPAEANQVSPSSVMDNWRRRVKTETMSSKNWSSEWGFLVEPGGGTNKSNEVYNLEKRARFQSTISLNLTEEARQVIEQERKGSGDTLDTFVRGYLKKGTRPSPKEEFTKPVLTSMDYGWGNDLERFGKLSIPMR
uniref:Uncharacterized protein n=2 Tax=Dunaliella tertiolecta TaxID=3047 RepID=A0A7S3VSQ1_DUNTE|mmetsp:Transcript_26599/g.71941  ORF Transcript_26599/g.71941 Transcript_26599/m.71941 type:complete len:137 (-) Transcript_26599:951-1361(-)